MLSTVLLTALLVVGVGVIAWYTFRTPKAKLQAQVGTVKDDQAKVESVVSHVESTVNSVEKKL